MRERKGEWEGGRETGGMEGGGRREGVCFWNRTEKPQISRFSTYTTHQSSPNFMSQYSVMEDEVFELREREGGMVVEKERGGRGEV